MNRTAELLRSGEEAYGERYAQTQNTEQIQRKPNRSHLQRPKRFGLGHSLTGRCTRGSNRTATIDLELFLEDSANRAAAVDAAVSEETALNAVSFTDLAALVRGIADVADDVQNARNGATLRTADFLDVLATDIAVAEASFQACDGAFLAAPEQTVLPRFITRHVLGS